MTIYTLYIFDRNGTCRHYSEWNRKNQSGLSIDEECKLMYGMLSSLKSFVGRMSPVDQKESFHSYRTNKYKLHFYETPSGLQFVMTTDLNVGNITDILQQMYCNIYLEYVVKNPFCSREEAVKSELFKTKLDEYVRGLPIFATKLS
ncbi:hypothetical protein LSH36_256g02038 [Paralvinella palmiformis]|uniref:Trafficking protein particle complex subunit n=1 Tax=Paralvinella palmiformis TaxID=53620 RepID=A0AAD9JKC7_9ANNE|nr:hypothetical protein LSH36_256g02038 [Paralvinella palmiformis]